MLPQDSLKQEVVESVKKSLTFDILYQRIRPDISKFIAVTSKLPLRSLDDWERLIREEIFYSLQKYSQKQSGNEIPQVGSLKWMDLCNADGFRRERALRTLSGGAPNSFLLALVVRKLNDWVPQVRAAACDALPLIAEKSDPEFIVDVLFITLPYWDSWGRMGSVEKEALMKVILMEKVTESLKKRLLKSSSGPVSTIFVQAGRTTALDNFIAEIAETSIQPSLRAKAYRCQFESKFVWAEGMTWQWVDKVNGIRRRIPVLKERIISSTTPFIENLRMATTDRSPMVRRIAGAMLIKELDNIGDEAFKLANILASDTSKSVAERGKYALTDLEKYD
ncbi:hypothetical protein [Yersinia bercovieri]|uniref:HEAT repeat domain-containing protein n=2 Tax=Yersinia bercovieri TaxID=634 RepID=A0A2G4U4S7_YERBE|nr:hypothetical protein [Yersinia bercovieri]EEQ04758.1 hypothetical protein yberc0001_38280 [Yersinia bercovieri ATCC 43970]MCB5304185.1 hypothetical protein [Yersinia bercovieri]PHZ28249.1 hypothetical protein CS533_05865 [Yersinia bercovieri]QKJ07976.1 hypothetical protein HRK25_14440 [Yersinia bercovieri ATCC 43970]CFQ36968.1 Uncharacterised protein [Yersinia bercovieri]